MNISTKISWAIADKITFLLYGLIFRILQIQALPPIELGLYGLFEATSIFLFIIADNFAILPLIKFGHDDHERPRVNFLSLILYLAVSIGLSILILLLSPFIAEALKEPRFSSVALFLPLYICTALPRMYFLAVRQRDLEMRSIFTANLLWMGTMAAVTTLLLLLDHLNRFEDMMIILFAGSIISSLHLTLTEGRRISFSRKGTLRIKHILNFSSYQVGSAILSNLLRRLDVYVVQFFFSTATTGIYQSAKVLFRVLESINHAIGSVLFPAVSRLIQQKKVEYLRVIIPKSISQYFWLSFLATTAAIIGAPILIPLLLPAAYHQGIFFFQVLALTGIFFPISIQMFILIAFGKTKRLLWYNIVAVCGSFLLLVGAGILHIPGLIPGGIVSYHAILGILLTQYLSREFRIPLWYPIQLRWIKKRREGVDPGGLEPPTS